MSEPTDAPGTATVTDRRPVPKGVLPRGVQTWLMVAVAGGMLLIILFTGQPTPPSGPSGAATVPQPANPDRVREYQERLRLLDAHAAREAADASATQEPLPPSLDNDTHSQPPPDALAAERHRREYDSLFVSSIVPSEPRGPHQGTSDRFVASNASQDSRRESSTPSVDEVADAVIRATARAGNSQPAAPQSPSPTPPNLQSAPQAGAGARYRLTEGTLIEAALTNRLDGAVAAPVNCLVTNAVYSQDGQHVLIPQGSRVLGETRPVQTFGESRLAVAFHRLLMPDGRDYRLDQFRGLNQVGDAGLKDRVNQHYLSTFGAAAAVGLISGLAQFVGTSGVGGDGDRTVVIAGGTADATAQSTAQVMNRFLNRPPTVTIREGHRVKVYVTSDLDVPEYIAPRANP